MSNYTPSFATSTIPRNIDNLAHQWPSYSGTIAGVRNNVSSIPINEHETTAIIPPPPPSTIAMHQLGPTNRPHIVFQRSKSENVSVPTDAIIKRESIV